MHIITCSKDIKEIPYKWQRVIANYSEYVIEQNGRYFLRINQEAIIYLTQPNMQKYFIYKLRIPLISEY